MDRSSRIPYRRAVRTFLDCVQEARRRTRRRPAEAERWLREAEPLAERAGDWADLAAGWGELGPGGHAEARRCADRAIADAGDELSVYRSVAMTHRRELGDVDLARTVLDRCAARVGARAGAALDEWCRLAGAYVLVLDDREVARGHLERAEATTPSPDVRELCTLADGYKEIADVDAARARVERAAAMLERGGDEGDAWTVANAQRALGDPDAGWRTLARGLERARTIAGCLRIAHAAASHLDPNQPADRQFVRACLDRAETLAATASDWVEVADAWHEHHFEAGAIRAALERAQAGDGDAPALARIAHGYRHWLGDAATADRLAPRGLAPAAIVNHHQRLDGWDPDPAALLDWLRPQLTDRALRAIAGGDWGSDGDKHLAALVDIHTTGLIPQPLAWHPREVLELYRWTQGDQTDHVARAFACTVLLLDGVGPAYRDGHEQTMAVLIDSCLVLGDEALARAVGLLVTVADGCHDYYAESLFAQLGLLMAAAARDPRDARLPALAERLIAAERAQHGEHGYRGTEWGWLLGRTNFDQRHKLWRRLGQQLLAEPARADPSLAYLADLAERLRRPPG